MTPGCRVKDQVAVIGAGVSGLIVGKRLKAEGLNPIIYERSDGPGGVWNFQHDGDSPFASAMYEGLEANFPRDLMELADYPWKQGTSLFPTRKVIEKYLRDYSADLHIEYGTEVVDVYRRTPRWPYDWKVITRPVGKEGKGEDPKPTVAKDFDFVVVAIGTFDRPFMPDYPGLEAWKKAFPDSVIHSKAYQRAEDFRGKNVLLVGNSASGWDISKQLAPLAAKVWVSSSRSNIPISDPRNELVPPIRCFNVEKTTIQLEGDNKQLSNVDSIIFCTGYHYSFPFLYRTMRAQKGLPRQLIWSDGYHIEGLWEHMVYIKRESLMFVGLPKAGPTWLIAQAQAQVVVRAVKRTLYYPSKKDMERVQAEESARWQDRVAAGEQGENERSYHNLPGQKCVDYIRRLEEWCQEADDAEEEDDGERDVEMDDVDGDGDMSGSKRNHRGPYRLTARKIWFLDNVRKIRDAFIATGANRHNFSNPESLGVSQE